MRSWVGGNFLGGSWVTSQLGRVPHLSELRELTNRTHRGVAVTALMNCTYGVALNAVRRSRFAGATVSKMPSLQDALVARCTDGEMHLQLRGSVLRGTFLINCKTNIWNSFRSCSDSRYTVTKRFRYLAPRSLDNNEESTHGSLVGGMLVQWLEDSLVNILHSLRYSVYSEELKHVGIWNFSASVSVLI